MPEPFGGRPVLAAVLCAAAVLAAAATGVIFQPGAWYAGLVKPPGTPPDWLFPVAWTTLYTLMAVAAWLVWRAAGPGGRGALTLFGVQLALNAVWTPVVFGAHALAAGLGVIVLLWLALAATIRAFGELRPAAAWLLAPYLAWVTYAGYLNAGLLFFN
ncbi:TspO/MBR family protein [Salinisphaera sp. PC39]|uniref:TspO/MBR family protein n=1 Tax=Salinisphaera sp. PC39 TaxID=1304156 RepID=UPI00333EB24B